MKYIVVSWNQGWLSQAVLCTDEAGGVLVFSSLLVAEDWANENLNGDWKTVCIINP